MAVFKCKMCGGTIEFEQGMSIGTCEYCQTKQTLPRLDNDKKVNLYDRADHFRRNNDFDKAMAIYEQILNEDSTDSESYWSLVLCRYGIEYIEDPTSHKRIPTVNRAQYTSIYADEDYKSAIQYADEYQKTVYEDEAKVIDDIQKGILEISQKEEPFDIFICYKETDANGRRTQDSVLANDLYHQLVQEGYKVFFSRITLEDKLGTAYEPYIFAALNSAKVMVVLGTRPEYFNAVWVKNEWSRYLALIKKGEKKMLIPAYRDMDPYDLPEEFSHLQAQDMSKLGFMQDLIRGIKKIVSNDDQKFSAVDISTPKVDNAAIVPLLERVFLFLEDGKWQDADIYCEKVLDINPKCAEAYLGKLMAELKVCKRQQLRDCKHPFNDSENYAKLLRFGDEDIENEIREYLEHINEQHYEEIYINAKKRMKEASSGAQYLVAADEFDSILGFADSEQLSIECREKAKNISEKCTRCKKLYGDELRLHEKIYERLMEVRKDEFEYYNMIFQKSSRGKVLKEKIDSERNEISQLRKERKSIVGEINANNYMINIKDQLENAAEGSIVVWERYKNCSLEWRVLEKKNRYCILISNYAIDHIKSDCLKEWSKDFLASISHSSNEILIPRYDKNVLSEIVERLKLGICTPYNSDEEVAWTFDTEWATEFAFTNKGSMLGYCSHEVWVRPAIMIKMDDI